MAAARRQNADPLCLCCAASGEGRILPADKYGGLGDAIRSSARWASWL